MSAHTLFALLATSAISLVQAQSPSSSALEPLASKHFTYPNLPYQVTGDQGGIRGPQFGYNLCNSTTEGPNSLCQTSFVNDITDFCMWSSTQPSDTIGESEAREVAWCTKPGHGTRVIPAGAISGVQWLYAKNYVQVVGFIDQTQVSLAADDLGGELDPHGADEQGNPLGGVVFSNGYGTTANTFDSALKAKQNGSSTYTQVIEWIDFIGGGTFCLKMCNPSDPQAAELCQHVYDRIGCTYNALADYGSINGTFQVCDSDDMTPPGVYTTNGQTTTWFQGPEGQPVSAPYTTSIPPSSNCHTYASTDLFAAAATVTPSSGASTAAPTGSGVPSSGSSPSGSVAASRSGSAQGASSTGTGGAVAVGASYVGLPMLMTVLLAVILA